MSMKARQQQIRKITKKAIEEVFKDEYDFMSLEMDLETADCDIPMDLDRLFKFDAFNFSHDVCGIVQHLNRRTAKLGDCFVPRCALPESAERPVGLAKHPAWFVPKRAKATKK